jgi:hypothetical protein
MSTERIDMVISELSETQKSEDELWIEYSGAESEHTPFGEWHFKFGDLDLTAYGPDLRKLAHLILDTVDRPPN